MKMIREWRASWRLATRSVATVDEYRRYLAQ